MGIFKDSLPQYIFLEHLGFKYESGATGEKGWTKIIEHNDNEILRITVDNYNNKVYLYNEWECCGMLWKKELDIPNGMLNDEDAFIEWLDNKI